MMRLKAALCAIGLLVIGACGKKDDSSPTPVPLDSNKAVELLPPVHYPYPKGGVTIGQGWDTYNDAGTQATCVDVAAVPLETSTYVSSVKLAQSSVSTLKEQTLAIKASYKGTGTKASASLTQESSRSLNVDALNYLFTFEAENGSTFAAPLGIYEQTVVEPLRLAQSLKQAAASSPLPGPHTPGGAERVTHIKFSAKAQKLLNDKQYASFAALCGQGFVAAIHRGARVDVVLSMSASKSTERDKLNASLSGSGYGVSASLSTSAMNSRQVELKNIGYRTFQEGGVPFVPNLVDSKTKSGTDLVDFSKLQPPADTLLQNPNAYRVLVVPYENLDPTIKGLLPTPLRMMSVAKYYVVLKDVYNLVDNIVEDARKKTPAYTNSTTLASFGGANKLSKLKDEIQFDLAVLELALDKCAKRESTCLVADAFGIVQAEAKKIDAAASAASAASASESARLIAAPASAGGGVSSASSSSRLVGSALSLRIWPFGINQPAKALTGNGKPTVSELDTANATLLKEHEARLQKADVAVDDFEDSHKALRSEIESIANSDLPASFYMRFYWYLAQIPPPKDVEDDYWDANDLKVTADKAPDKIVTAVNSVREKIGKATLNVRLLPWKRFFCEDFKHEALCVSETSLEELVAASGIYVIGDKLEIAAAPRPKKKKCKSVAGTNCWKF